MTANDDRLDDLQALHGHAEALALEQIVSPELPAEIESWLARLALLYGVPFEHLVPDLRSGKGSQRGMMPIESLRWFYIDANWIESLVDGAFSAGAHSDRDIRYNRVMEPVIRNATDVAAGKLRRQLRGEAAADPGTRPPRDDRIRAGFLMRSAIVSGWPGLEVHAYEGSADLGTETNPTHPADQIAAVESTEKVELLRMDRLSPEVLLCIFAQVPGSVVIHEPAEGLHFGLEANRVTLRDPDTGRRLASGAGVAATARSNNGVLDIGRLAADLGAAVTLGGRTFGPADFAVQMIDAADKQLFTPGAKA